MTGKKKGHRGLAGFSRKGGFDRRRVFHSLLVIRSVKDPAAPKPYVPHPNARQIDGRHKLAGVLALPRVRVQQPFIHRANNEERMDKGLLSASPSKGITRQVDLCDPAKPR